MGAVRHRFSVEEYQKMGEAGILSEDDRVELVDGEVVELAAIGKRHVESVMRLTRLLSRWTLLEAPNNEEGDAAYLVSVQNPVILSEHGAPQPDLVVVRRREGSSGVPVPEEALLVVEVADTSLAYDRNTKLPLYATVGIPEAWLVDLTTDTIEVHSEPGAEGYGKVTRSGHARKVVSATLQDLTFDAAEALPPVG
jgi:Uma2 family endonuclease